MSIRRMTFPSHIASAALAIALLAQTSSAGEPAPLKDLMTKVVEPTSNAVFYIGREAPQSDDDWKILQGKALMLLESANLLQLPDRYPTVRAKNKTQWIQDAKLLADASQKAYVAANAKNTNALEELNDALYTACTTCHEHFMPKR